MAKKQMEPGEADALINELEQKMNRLRSLYEQYFMGIERMPPRTQRKEVVRLINTLEHAYIRNTALKFKIRSLIQRFNSYKAYWRRVERQIEEGTYVRDVRRAERNRERRRERTQRAEEAVDDGILELDMNDVMELDDLQAELEELDAAGAFDEEPQRSQGRELSAEERERIKKQKLAEIAGQLGIDDPPEPAPKPTAKPGAKPAADPSPEAPSNNLPTSGAKPQRRGARAAPGSAAKKRQKLADIKRKLEKRTGKKIGSGSKRTGSGARGGSGGGDDEARRVYKQLVEAKKRCNESTSGLSYDKLAKSMNKQREQLKKKRGARKVEFKVVIKDGRAFLKPETK